MRTLAILAHPSSASFDTQLFQHAIATLKAGGHELRVLDLYGEGFEARLSEPEWRDNAKVPQNQIPVAEHVRDLKWAEALVLVFPTWWSGIPAILKGWFDRVFLPGVAFELKDDGPGGSLLTDLKVFAVITTGGSTWWQVLALLDPVRVHIRALRLSVAPHARSIFLRLSRMDSRTDAERQRFLERVTSRLESL